jgi:hypothetical protein
MLLPRRPALSALVLLGFAARCAGDQCSVSTVVVHCESSCAGVNATSWASTNPPAMLLMNPKIASASEKSAVLAELEAESAPRSGLTPPGMSMLELESKPEPTAEELSRGTPTFAGAVTAEQMTEQTIYAPVHEAISPDDLIGLIGPADKVEWSAVKSAPFACVDGRFANGELYAYGGDFGEFLLALTVYEQMLQKQLSQAETTYLFGKWLGEGASFAMCTDAAAVTQLASAVGARALDLARPPEEHAASLMLRVIAPEFQGDEHTKWVLQHPDTYAVRRVLAEQLIRSFFGVLWNEYHPLRPKLTLHVLSGAHAERALVKVHGSHWCWAEQGLAPAMPAKTKLGSVFLYNVEAVTLRRSALVAFFSTQVTPVVEPGEMMTRMSALGEGQAHLTEKAQAGALRGYTVLFK